MYRIRGLTVIELLVSLAVAAVLIGLALPAFQNFVAQRTLTTQVNDFVIAVTLARSEAARRRGVVSVQAINPSNGNEWGGGWCVTVGQPGDCANPLRMFPALGDNTMNATGGLQAIDELPFNARGLMTLNVAGAIDLCDPDIDPGRRITVSVIGRVNADNLPVCP